MRVGEHCRETQAKAIESVIAAPCVDSSRIALGSRGGVILKKETRPAPGSKCSVALYPVSPHSNRSEADAGLNRYERLLAVVGATLPVARFDKELRVTGER